MIPTTFNRSKSTSGNGGGSSSNMAAQQLDFFFSAIRRWWKIALPIGVVAAAGAFAFLVLTKPPMFESDAVLRVRRDTPYIAFQDSASGRSDRFASTQLALFRTRSVLEPAYVAVKEKFPEVAVTKDGTHWLDEKLKAHISHSELVTLRFQAESPELSQAALTGILDSYMVYSQSIEANSEDRVIELLAQERDARKNLVNQTRDKVREEVQASGVVFAEDDLASFLSNASFNAMEQILINAEVDIEVLSARLTAEEERVASGDFAQSTEHELMKFVNTRPDVAAILQSIDDAQDRLDVYSRRLANPSNSPLVIKTKEELKELNRQLVVAQGRVRGEAEQEFKQLSEDSNAERLRELQNQVAAKIAIRNRLMSRLEEEKKKISGDAIDVEFARDELAMQEDIYDRISSRIVALQTERRAPDRVELVDPPRLPKKAVSVSLKKPIVAACAALLAPFALCVLFERINERVASADSLATESGIPAFGETAKLPQVGGNGVIEKFLPYRESVGSIGSLLQLSCKPEEKNVAQVISILSSVAHEGKTSLSTHLAAFLGRGEQRRTLLLEADFRAPTVRHVLGLEKAPGLAQVLSGDCDLEDSIRPVFVPDYGEMDVLTVGNDAIKSLPLNFGAIESILEQLRSRYDYIVIDTSPILCTNEALPMAMLSDLNILCVMKGESRLAQVRHSVARLNKVDVELVGFVLNGVEPRSYYSRYGRYGAHADTV